MKSNRLLYCFIIATIVAIIVPIINSKVPSWALRFYTHTYSPATRYDADKLETLMRHATYELIESETWGGKPFMEKTLWACITAPDYSVYGFGEYGLLMHYSYLYALHRNDIELKQLIKEKFDKGFRNGGGKILRNDQIAYGNLAIDLYKETSDSFYKEFADKLYMRLDSIEKADGIILYRREGGAEQHVDAIGLVCPFLFYYAKTFHNQRSSELGHHMAEEYIKWGTDDVTGIPVQTYNTKNHVKYNHVNWGRGISWFVIGTRDMDSPDDSLLQKRLCLLDSTLLSNKEHLYSQYFNQGNTPDMSATIPVLYHLINKGLLKMTKKEFSALVSPYCDNKGIIRYCSPSIAYPHEGVNVALTSLWCQGLCLYLLANLT